MAKPRFKQNDNFRMISSGIYSNWNKRSKYLPVLDDITDTIPARLSIEFGYIINIKKAKRKNISFIIQHPPIVDNEGNLMPDFTGEVTVKTNDWNFFLGDTIWEPVEEKIGIWRLITKLNGKIIADKTFNVVEDENDNPDR